MVSRVWQSRRQGESGQATAELALAIPLFAVSLLMVTNILFFVHGATVFDRAVEQWSRANVCNPKNPFSGSVLPIWFVLGPNPNPRFQASCGISAEMPGPFEMRTYQFTLYYTPYGSEVFTALGLRSPVRWVRKKSIVSPRYKRAVVF